MRPLADSLLALALLAPALVSSASGGRDKDAVLLSKLRTLTLHGDGALTTHRRVPAVPQLQCASAARVCALATVDVMRCEQAGAAWGGADDVQWTCTASLPSTVRLGATDVTCEGYAAADDPWVLRGSCGVRFRLVPTDEGERRLGAAPTPAPTDAGGSRLLFGLIFVAVLAWIVYGALSARGHDETAPRRPPRARGGGGGGGGGPDNDDNDPPPPYPGPPRHAKPNARQNQQQQEGWRPGFWSGALGGAAAGYLAGGRNQRQPDGWNATAGPSRPRPSSTHNSDPAPASTMRESTGFGSTSLR